MHSFFPSPTHQTLSFTLLFYLSFSPWPHFSPLSLRRSNSTGSGREWMHAAARWDHLSLWAAGRHSKPAKGNNTAEKQRWRSHQAMSSCSGNQEFDTIIWTRGFPKGCQHFLCAQTLLLFSLKIRIAFLITCRSRPYELKLSAHSMIIVTC